jgi:hypothetical protein
MATIFTHWQNENQQRNFPFADQASRMSDKGNKLPNDFLVGASFSMPMSAGKFIHVSSASITDNLLSATFLAIPAWPFIEEEVSSSSDGDTSMSFTPLGSISVARSELTPFRNYAIQSQYPGFYGWVAFGPNRVEEGERHFFLFGSPEQSVLNPRCVKIYNDIPVLSAGRLANSVELSGIVRLSAGNDLKIVQKPIGDGDCNTIVVKLNTDTAPGEVLRRYAGPCSARPDSQSCRKRPFESVNGITPDEDGCVYVDLVFIVPTQLNDGVSLSYELGLSDVCPGDNLPDTDGELYPDDKDLCDTDKQNEGIE